MSKEIQQRDDVFLMMTQEQHDDYTRELEDKIDFLMQSLMNYNTMTSEDIDNLLLDFQRNRRKND